MAVKILINAMSGKDDPERATLAFIMGNISAGADQETVVLLTVDGVWLATKGYADHVAKEGFPPLSDVISSFKQNGGEIWACGTCTKPRGISESDLIDGARVVTAANVVEYIASGAATLGF